MKETKIAEEFIKEYQVANGIDNKLFWKTICIKLKEKDQRWLEYLLEFVKWEILFLDKVKDLKQAIKLYEDAGI